MRARRRPNWRPQGGKAREHRTRHGEKHRVQCPRCLQLTHPAGHARGDAILAVPVSYSMCVRVDSNARTRFSFDRVMTRSAHATARASIERPGWGDPAGAWRGAERGSAHGAPALQLSGGPSATDMPKFDAGIADAINVAGMSLRRGERGIAILHIAPSPFPALRSISSRRASSGISACPGPNVRGRPWPEHVCCAPHVPAALRRRNAGPCVRRRETRRQSTTPPTRSRGTRRR